MNARGGTWNAATGWLYQSIKPFDLISYSTESLCGDLNNLCRFRIDAGRFQIVNDHICHVRTFKAVNKPLAEFECRDAPSSLGSKMKRICIYCIRCSNQNCPRVSSTFSDFGKIADEHVDTICYLCYIVCIRR